MSDIEQRGLRMSAACQALLCEPLDNVGAKVK